MNPYESNESELREKISVELSLLSNHDPGNDRNSFISSFKSYEKNNNQII